MNILIACDYPGSGATGDEADSRACTSKGGIAFENLRYRRSLHQHVGDGVDRYPSPLYTGAARIISGSDPPCDLPSIGNFG